MFVRGVLPGLLAGGGGAEKLERGGMCRGGQDAQGQAWDACDEEHVWVREV